MTTGSISGTVLDQQGGALPGAVVLATHVPTGTGSRRCSTDGRFAVLNISVGPYNVKVTMSGFKDVEQKDVNVGLGENRGQFKLELATVTQRVTVTGEAPKIDIRRAGTAANISRRRSRICRRFRAASSTTRATSPFVSLNQDSAGGEQVINVAGRNNRYNNMQIDGAVNNDVFALARRDARSAHARSRSAWMPSRKSKSLLALRRAAGPRRSVNAVTKSGTKTFAAPPICSGAVRV